MKSVSKIVNDYLPGLDYLRAIFCIFVVMWHIGFGTNQAMQLITNFLDKKYILFYIFNLNFLLLAVPGFLLMSNFLFVHKNGTISRLKINIQKNLSLFVFWALITKLFSGNIGYFISLVPKNGLDVFQLLTGGFSGLYFFLISLSITQVITYYIKNFSFKIICIGSIVSLITTFLLSFFSLKSGNVLIVSYYNPLNFISVPFLAVLLNKVFNSNTEQKKFILISLTIGIVSVILEWYILPSRIFFQVSRFGMPEYMRPSIYLFSTFLILLAFRVTKLPIKIISILSYYSLPIYLLHPVYLDWSHIIVEKFSIQYLQLRNLVASVLCIVITLFVIKIFEPYFKRKTGITK